MLLCAGYSPIMPTILLMSPSPSTTVPPSMTPILLPFSYISAAYSPWFGSPLSSIQPKPLSIHHAGIAHLGLGWSCRRRRGRLGRFRRWGCCRDGFCFFRCFRRLGLLFRHRRGVLDKGCVLRRHFGRCLPRTRLLQRRDGTSSLPRFKSHTGRFSGEGVASLV